MKKWLGFIFVLLLISCVDEEMRNKQAGDGEVVVAELNLWTPALSNSSLTKAMGEADEAAVNELYVLVFDEKDQFLYGNKAQSIIETDVISRKTAKVQLRTTSETVTIVALANMEQDGVDFSLPAKGDDKTTFLKTLVYKVSEAWPAVSKGEEGFRPFPMWGELQAPVTAAMEMNILRALARINLTIAAGQNFKMSEIQVYNSREGGYCSPIGDVIIGSGTNAGNVNSPSVPSSGGGLTGSPLNYAIEDAEEDTIRSYAGEIYIPEALATDGVYLKVGGTIEGIAKSYKVEFKQNNTQLAILRNHTYNINVKRVGTGESDCDVTIEAWSDVTMRNPNSQYSLTVDKSSIAFVATEGASETIEVETDYADGWKPDGRDGDWFVVTRTEDGKLKITTKADNAGAKREGYIIIRAGQLVKKISLTQKEQATANCYIVSKPGTEQLFVNLKGNGSDGLTAEGLSGQLSTTAELKPDKVAIIWETAGGLVTIDGTGVPDKGIISYTVNSVGKNNTFIGGNALIGAYKRNSETSYTLLWSWHIWVVPDFKDGIKDENWTATGYTFIDRYLGATSNQPGIASLGLLYQWGRKDPLIGPKEVKESPEKAYTKMYPKPGTTSNYAWGSSGNNTTNYSIENPTTILSGGLCTNDKAYGNYLWGTNKGFQTTVGGQATNAGNKTIYDPCPVGYRVPPVDAFVFHVKNGKTDYSTYTYNWSINNRYVPNNEKNWDWHSANNPGNAYGEASYVGGKDYGFWVSYKSGGMWNSDASRPDVSSDGKLQSGTATWLPLGGVYDGNMDNFSLVDGQSSVTVNSIVWTNSPITLGNNSVRPAAMFLHGTEKNGGINGRHLHKLNETGSLAAKTQHAGSVRCVKDIKKDYSDLSSISPSSVTLAGDAGATLPLKLTSINEDWEVADPGAKWFYVTPQEGKADGGGGQQLTLVAPNENYVDVPDATLVIRLKDSGKELKVTVKRSKLSTVFTVTPSSLKFAAIGGAQDVSITAVNGWDIQTLPDWVKANAMSSNKGSAQIVTFTVIPNASFTNSRSADVVVKQRNTGVTKKINITQPAAIFDVSKTALTFTVSGGSQTATIEATQGWSITDKPAWLTISPSSNSDALSKTVTFTAVKNATYAKRTGAVKVVSGIANKEITVTQNGGTEPKVSPNPISLGKDGKDAEEVISITCDADVTWTIVVDDYDWLKIDKKTDYKEDKNTYTGKGTIKDLKVKAQKWDNTVLRTGTITITFSTGEKIVLTVNQKK